jgi:hypothetical protein
MRRREFQSLFVTSSMVSLSFCDRRPAAGHFMGRKLCEWSFKAKAALLLALSAFISTDQLLIEPSLLREPASPRN